MNIRFRIGFQNIRDIGFHKFLGFEKRVISAARNRINIFGKIIPVPLSRTPHIYKSRNRFPFFIFRNIPQGKGKISHRESRCKRREVVFIGVYGNGHFFFRENFFVGFQRNRIGDITVKSGIKLIFPHAGLNIHNAAFIQINGFGKRLNYRFIQNQFRRHIAGSNTGRDQIPVVF